VLQPKWPVGEPESRGTMPKVRPPCNMGTSSQREQPSRGAAIWRRNRCKKGRAPPLRPPAFPPLLCQHPHWQSASPLSHGRLLLRLSLGDGCFAGDRNWWDDLRADQPGHARYEHFAVATARLRRLEGTSGMEIAIG